MIFFFADVAICAATRNNIVANCCNNAIFRITPMPMSCQRIAVAPPLIDMLMISFADTLIFISAMPRRFSLIRAVS